MKRALQSGMAVERIAQLTGIDPWFLYQLEEMVHLEGRVRVIVGARDTVLMVRTPGPLPSPFRRRGKGSRDRRG